MRRTHIVAIGLLVASSSCSSWAQEGRGIGSPRPRAFLASLQQAENPIDNPDLAPSPFEPPYQTSVEQPGSVPVPVQAPASLLPQSGSVSISGRSNAQVYTSAPYGSIPTPLVDLMTDDPCGHILWRSYRHQYVCDQRHRLGFLHGGPSCCGMYGCHQCGGFQPSGYAQQAAPGCASCASTGAVGAPYAASSQAPLFPIPMQPERYGAYPSTNMVPSANVGPVNPVRQVQPTNIQQQASRPSAIFR
jgi:hypothetical protein